VVTERRNSMITGTCARLVAGAPHAAYLRGLLKRFETCRIGRALLRRRTERKQWSVDIEKRQPTLHGARHGTAPASPGQGKRQADRPQVTKSRPASAIT
ncbi:hypothetical protein ACWD4L_49835, partial [Streptomyces sp. NPDC002596]